jgi:hypothetical protein
MSAPIDDGGPAFPIPDSHHANGQVQYGANGMTLRDWFAGQALAGEMASQSAEKGEYLISCSSETLEKKASLFYRFADAMIAARKEGRP